MDDPILAIYNKNLNDLSTFRFLDYEPIPNPNQQIVTIVIVVLIPALIVIIVISVGFWYCRRKKLGYFQEVSVKKEFGENCRYITQIK